MSFNTYREILVNSFQEQLIDVHLALKKCDILMKYCWEGITKGANLAAILKA